MEINKKGFYDLSNDKDNKIIICEGVAVDIFDSGAFSRSYYLGENSQVNYYSKVGASTIFYQNSPNSLLNINVLLCGNAKLSLLCYISSDNCTNNTKILSILDSNEINLDGIIRIAKGKKNINASLKEENIIVGDGVMINASPKLLIESEDVSAKHSCSVERLDKKKLFYLSSRGIESPENIIVDSKVRGMFSKISS